MDFNSRESLELPQTPSSRVAAGAYAILSVDADRRHPHAGRHTDNHGARYGLLLRILAAGGAVGWSHLARVLRVEAAASARPAGGLALGRDPAGEDGSQ